MQLRLKFSLFVFALAMATSSILAQQEGRCGIFFGTQGCPAEQCCSPYGYCGSSPEHCGRLNSGTPREDGRCGPDFDDAQCADHHCCHPVTGWCGNTTAHCANVIRNDTTLPRFDGRCGPWFGRARCLPDSCCSAQGFCGTTEEHCNHDGFVEPDDFDLFEESISLKRCGDEFGECDVGQCCDSYGFCGSGIAFCGDIMPPEDTIVITGGSDGSSNSSNSTRFPENLNPEQEDGDGIQQSGSILVATTISFLFAIIFALV